MSRADLDRYSVLWPDVGLSPWGSCPPWPHETPLGTAVAEYDRRVAARAAARTRLRMLRGRAQYTAGGWDVEHVVFIGDASTGIGGCWLCHRELTYWEASWTRDLTGFEPHDDAAREVLAFVALQIELDHHLGDRAADPGRVSLLPHDARMRYLK